MPEGAWEESHAREAYVSDTGIIGFRGSRAKQRTWYNHMPALSIREQIGHEIWNRYFKFTTIRNPYDKLISYFSSKLAKKQNYNPSKRALAFARRTLDLGKPIDRIRGHTEVELFRSWIEKGGDCIDREKYMIDNEVCMDFFIRFEYLHEDIRHVCNQLGLPFEPQRLPEFKKGKRTQRPIKDYYDERTRQIVEAKYAWELREFNYSL